MNGQLIKAPVYQQLNELLRQLIRGGEFKARDRFLTERQIAERFGVSRATANKALSNLVSEGVVEFRKGLGTFVQGGMLDVDLGLLVSFTARAESLGRKPRTVVLTFARDKARQVEPEAARRLGLAGEDAVFVLDRVRLADDVPVILERRVVNARLAPGLDARAAGASLYAFFTKKLGLAVAGADQVIRAVSASGEEARHLEVRRGAPCLEVRAVGTLADGAPLWWERTVYRGDAYQFGNRVGGDGRRGAASVLDLVSLPTASARPQ